MSIRHTSPSRRQPRRLGRTAWLLGGIGLCIIAVVAIQHVRLSAKPASSAVHATVAVAPSATESGLLPWKLQTPLSRMSVLPGGPNQLIIIGGLTANGASSSGIYSLSTLNGALTHIGDLASQLHDAATAIVAGRYTVFGGGSPATIATVQSFAGAGALTGSPVGRVDNSVSLPHPRSDAAATTIGHTTYVIGGYDGSSPDRAILATTDDRTFTTIASLPVAVRYPAVTTLDGRIYVFGGLAVNGATAGQPVSTIQIIDPSAHTATVAPWSLPQPLAGAVAVTINNEIFLAGGQSNTPQSSIPGAGTTQLSPDMVAGTPSASSSTTGAIWAVNPVAGKLLKAGQLQVPVSNAGVAVLGSTAWIVGGESNGQTVSAVQLLTPNRAFGTAGAAGAGSPYFGSKLLIADRGNNRLLFLDSSNTIVWHYPSSSTPPDQLGFYFPDDAFFINHGTAIISNQEQNETVVEIAYPSGKIIWSYGHPKQPSAAPGYLHEPDDAYLLKNGQIVIADAQNCRVLVLNPNGSTASQIGTNGVCVHNPPQSIGSPNGDTPLFDGNILISEINGSWVSEYTLSDSLVWTVHLPIAYPSDPQQLGASPGHNPDHYLIADYASPGEILQFTRTGQILSKYAVASGPGMLDHPSLVELLPSGMYMVNDDYRDRMVAIDPATGALVWQYGVSDHAGTSPGMLTTPDGFDLLLPNGTTPTHLPTG